MSQSRSAHSGPRRCVARWRLLWLVVLVATAGPAVAASFDAQMREYIDNYIAIKGLDPELVERERILAEARKRYASGTYGKDEVASWVTQELDVSFYSFAEPWARHDLMTRYRLPFDERVPRPVSEATGGGRSHRGPFHHAVDFLLPIGTPVLAAREGHVGRVIDGWKASRNARKVVGQGNAVLVVHEDDTFALYAHLSPGIAVKEHQRVERGQLLGYSGNSGSTAAPQLHLSVHRLMSRGKIESIPVRFGTPGKPGFVPETGRYYGRPPKATVELRISVAGDPLDLDEPISIQRGGSVELGIRIVGPEGIARDPTPEDQLVVSSMTPWVIDTSEAGRVFARPMEGFNLGPEYEGVRTGLVTVLVGAPGSAEVGAQKLEFDIHDPKAQAPK